MHRACALGLVTAFAAGPSAFGLVDARTLLLGAPPESAPADAAPAIAPAAAPVRFGAKDSWRLDLEGEWAGDLDAINLGLSRIGVAWFFVDHFEVALYATLGGASEASTDAFVYGGDLEFRWHFLAFERWSVFASAGCGIIGATEPVPTGGTEFNFTPCAGGGVTFDVWEGTRLYLSARWFHISNASTSSNNPGFNGLGLWAGLSFAL
ncbi:MAG: acyloxyacyl hydrolase [Phycisphaerales bacterium]